MSELDPRRELSELARIDFGVFAAGCFATLNPGQELERAEYIEVMASRLADVGAGRNPRLVINIPPRHLKSMIGSIAFPAWCLGLDPTAQIMCVSYGQDLALKLARDARTIMTSDWYRNIFPKTRLASQRPALEELITTAGGCRLANSVHGSVTGRGADIILIDDPLKPDEAMSDSQRQAANDWFDGTLVSRLNDQRHGAIVLIMQRLHEDDLTGHVLEQEAWEHLCLPAIAEADERHAYRTAWSPRTFCRKQGESLHPKRLPLDRLENLRRSMGSYHFAAQYQQRPAPAGGGIVKPEWFPRYQRDRAPESFERIVQSWDTANKVSELSDYSVCTTWGLNGDQVYLLHVFRQKLEFPDLKRAVRGQQKTFSANVVLIEEQASGTQLIQELNRDGLSAVTAYKPIGDKIMRMRCQTAMIEAGRVHLPAEAPWLDEYLAELAGFPKGKHDDQVDSTAQFLNWLNTPMKVAGLYEFTRRQAEKCLASLPVYQTPKLEFAVGSVEWKAEQDQKQAEQEARARSELAV